MFGDPTNLQKKFDCAPEDLLLQESQSNLRKYFDKNVKRCQRPNSEERKRQSEADKERARIETMQKQAEEFNQIVSTAQDSQTKSKAERRREKNMKRKLRRNQQKHHDSGSQGNSLVDF